MPSLTPEEWRTIADAVYSYHVGWLMFSGLSKSKVDKAVEIANKLIAKRDNIDCFGNR